MHLLLSKTPACIACYEPRAPGMRSGLQRTCSRRPEQLRPYDLVILNHNELYNLVSVDASSVEGPQQPLTASRISGCRLVLHHQPCELVTYKHFSMEQRYPLEVLESFSLL